MPKSSADETADDPHHDEHPLAARRRDELGIQAESEADHAEHSGSQVRLHDQPESERDDPADADEHG